MLTGDRRLGSARRGMTVLGKIPSAPKPVNLPSQRLESGGLDPSVEIVPRGTLSWRSAGHSPPTTHCPWGNTGLSSSSPVSTGVWNGASMVQKTSVTENGAGNVIEHLKRPSSAGSGTHPRSDLLSTSGAWSDAAKSEDRLQPSRFTLTPTDFPSLGSEKNPDLRPQQTGASSGRPASADGTFPGKERRSLGAPEFDGHGRSGLGPESFSHVAEHHRDFSPTFGCCEIPSELGHNQDSLPYDGYCASPSSVCYGSMEARDMLMQGMTGNPRVYKKKLSFQGFSEQSGQPGNFGSSFCQLGPTEHFGRHESGKHMDGWVSENLRDSVCVDMVKGASDSELLASVSGVGTSFYSRNYRTQQSSGRIPSQHGDWGAVFHADRHMELSKSVAEGQLCSAVVAPLGSKELNMSSGDKMCHGQVSETELLRPGCNSGQSTNKREKHIIEGIEGVGDINSYELLMVPVVSGEAVPIIKESSEFEKACVQGDLQISRELEKVSKVSGCVNIPQPEGVDIVNSAVVKIASISQNLVSENEEKIFCPVNCSMEDLSSRLMACVGDASSPNLPLQNPGKSALLCGMLSSSCVSDSAAVSASESSTTSTEKPDCVVSPSSILKSRTSGSESLDKNDKGYRDAPTGGVFSTTADLDQVNSTQNSRNASNDNLDHSDDKRPKLRTKNRDGEKIWRPKLPAVDAELNLKQAGDSFCTSAIETNNSSNKGSFEQSNQQVLDQYDYEGQRAKLRETAAQRAKQRQKEEEERTKEQKAKALAKLEELNRRASVVASTVDAAVSDDSVRNIESLEPEMEQQSSIKLRMQSESQTNDIPETRGSFECSRHGIKNDRGKWHWEHKRPLSSREGHRLKAIEGKKNVPKDIQNGMQGASIAVPSTLPILPLSSTSQALLSDAASQQVQQQQIMRSRTKNHALGGSHLQQRSKQCIPLLKQVSGIRDKESSSLTPVVVGDGGSHDESISSLEALLGSDASIGSNPGLNGGASASRRKRESQNTKGKQRVEGHIVMLKPAVTTERASLVSDLSSDDTSGDGSNVKVSTTGTTGRELMAQENYSVVEVVPAQVSIQGLLALDIEKDISFGTLQEDDYAEFGVKKHNHDRPNKRIQGKSSSSKCFHGDQPLPDTCVVTGRQHTREGVSAPVQTFAIPVGIGNVEMDSNEEKVQKVGVKSKVSTSRNSARIKRVEIERYNPKLAVKSQTHLQADHHRQTQRHARDLPFLEEQAISFHGAESHQSTESLTTGSKFMTGNEISTAVRPGQSYTFRRQRNPHDSYIFKEAFSNVVNASTGKLSIKHSDEASKELPDRLHADVADLASQSSNFHKARNDGAELPRTAAEQPLKHRSHPSELKRDELAAPSSGYEIQSTGALEIDISSPKVMQIHRGKTHAHVPMRSAKGKSSRQHSQHAQADAELHVCSGIRHTECVLENDEIDNWNFHDQESNHSPHSAGANIPPQQHHLDDREKSSPATGAELNQNSGLIEQDKSLIGPVYHEKKKQSPQTLQTINQIQWVREDINAHDNSSMLQKCSSSLGHDVKSQLCMENAVPVHRAPQKGVSASQSSLQSLQRDHAKKFGSFSNHHQRKCSSSHVQWQQAASSSNEKLTPTLVAGPIHPSVLDTPKSVFGQQIACQIMKPLSTKLNFASAEN